nr:hypothetical protein [Microcystis aeruginosa]
MILNPVWKRPRPNIISRPKVFLVRVCRRRQLVEMRTAEKNRRECSRGKALAAIEAHLEDLDNCLEKLNQEIEKLTQANQQWIVRFANVARTQIHLLQHF